MKLTGISRQELLTVLRLLNVSDEIEKEDLQALYDYMVATGTPQISGEYSDNGMQVDQALDSGDVYHTARDLLYELADKEDYGSIQINQQGIFKFIHWWDKELHVTIGDE